VTPVPQSVLDDGLSAANQGDGALEHVVAPRQQAGGSVFLLVHDALDYPGAAVATQRQGRLRHAR
jgi:hypothetical protein